jgi:hypothetical protein
MAATEAQEDWMGIRPSEHSEEYFSWHSARALLFMSCCINHLLGFSLVYISCGRSVSDKFGRLILPFHA